MATATTIGPYSRADRLRNLDGRSRIGRHIRDFETALVAHAGPSPGFAVRALIDQAVSLEVQIKLLEQAGINTDHARRCYAAWLNSKRLTLREIGLKGVEAKPKTVTEIAAEITARRASLATAP